MELVLPPWMGLRLNDIQQRSYSSPAALMHEAVELSRESVRHGGGPFGALIYDPGPAHVIAVGANLVLPEQCSLWHAEVVAIYQAQKMISSYSLRSNDSDGLELYASCEPCMMCQGAVFWSGIRHLYYAARDEDARRIGFDEGIKHPDWQGYFQKRGIQVTADLLRHEAQEVLDDYVEQGGPLYNE
ncbi:MAG: nucleoside deaminase [Verrucomicrobiota bacterium]